MAYILPKLPYAYDSLEPYIDEKTMRLHYDKHYKGYVDKLNESLKNYPKYQKYSPEVLVANWKKLPKAIQDDVRNQGGGVLNHSIFWTLMKRNSGGSPSGKISEQINSDFGSFEKFTKKFNETGIKRFGSGWIWLIFSREKLQILSLPNQDNPLTNGDIPIIGIDVWEHAYYLNYENDRAEYLEKWWNVVNWDVVNQRFEQAMVMSARKPNKNEVKKQYGI